MGCVGEPPWSGEAGANLPPSYPEGSSTSCSPQGSGLGAKGVESECVDPSSSFFSSSSVSRLPK